MGAHSIPEYISDRRLVWGPARSVFRACRFRRRHA